jgi:hypothetical protein
MDVVERARSACFQCEIDRYPDRGNCVSKDHAFSDKEEIRSIRSDRDLIRVSAPYIIRTTSYRLVIDYLLSSH